MGEWGDGVFMQGCGGSTGKETDKEKVKGLREEIDGLKKQRKEDEGKAQSMWFGQAQKEHEKKMEILDKKIEKKTGERTSEMHKSYDSVKRVRGESREWNVENDPLANITLDEKEQKKVDKIVIDKLKYLNKLDTQAHGPTGPCR